MNKNYLILAHKNPEQIDRLIDRLDDEYSRFFIHVDLKCDIQDFELIKKNPRTTIIDERENCLWGDFSIVKATIHLIKNIVELQRGGFSILLSGQDYPVKSKHFINEFLTKNKELNFIDVQKIEEKWNKKMVLDKTAHYHFIHSDLRGHSNSYAPFFGSSATQKFRNIAHLLKGRLPMKTFQKLLKLPQRLPLYKQQFAGSQWWALNDKTLNKLYQYIKEHQKDLENYYQYTSAPDEIFFQSVLMNILTEAEKTAIHSSLTYTNWERKNCTLPVTFNENDFGELANIPHLFARKFDTEYDEKILNLIDSRLLTN